MAQSSNTTTDHDEIQKWVEKRKGKPAHVKDSGKKGDEGILRIDFPPNDSDRLEEISWDDFFEKFDKSNLAFLYQEKKADGEVSYFNKFVSRDNDE
jgi:hypothetical protein